MTEKVLCCPECGSDQIVVAEVTKWMINTMEHYCHSTKAHNIEAQTECLTCGWNGCRGVLHERDVHS